LRNVTQLISQLSATNDMRKVDPHYSHAGNLHGSQGYSSAPHSCDDQNTYHTFCCCDQHSSVNRVAVFIHLIMFGLPMTCWYDFQDALIRAHILRHYGSRFKFTDLKEKEKAEPLKQYFGYNRHFWINRFGVLVIGFSLFTGIFIASYFSILCNRGLAPIYP
jgi:hypothetical protein